MFTCYVVIHRTTYIRNDIRFQRNITAPKLATIFNMFFTNTKGQMRQRL